jgi:hypothetical protein
MKELVKYRFYGEQRLFEQKISKEGLTLDMYGLGTHWNELTKRYKFGYCLSISVYFSAY